MMPASFRRREVRVVLVVLAVGVACLVGWQWTVQRPAKGPVAAKHGLPGTAAVRAPAVTPEVTVPAPPEPVPRDPGLWSREEAWEQWQAELAQPEGFGILQFVNDSINRTDWHDLPFLVEHIGQLPPTEDRDLAESQLLFFLSLHDPVAALALVGAITDARQRNDATNQIYGRLAVRASPEVALAELAKLPSGQGTQAAYWNVFEGWAGANPDYGSLAASDAVALPAGPNRTQALRGVATGWSNANPNAALIWAASLPPEDAAAIESALKAVGRLDPNLAAQYLDNVPDATTRGQAIQNIAVSMAKSDPAGALAWLDQVTWGTTYDQSAVKIFSTLAVSNPRAATALLGQVAEPGDQEAVIAGVADSAWAKVNPKGAAAWLQTLPDSVATARDAAVQKLRFGPTSENPPP